MNAFEAQVQEMKSLIMNSLSISIMEVHGSVPDTENQETINEIVVVLKMDGMPFSVDRLRVPERGEF